MEERRFLADMFDASFLMDLCEGLTDFQSYEAIHPFLGQWIRVTGALTHATPNPAFGTAGVTIDFPDEGSRRDAFLTFHRDLDRLGRMNIGEVITAEGQIKTIRSSSMVLERCGLADPQLVSILKVRDAAEGLRKAVEVRIASGNPILLKPDEPAPHTDQENIGDDNATDLPNVDFEHLKLWHAAFVAAYPQSSEKVALASARTMFPNYFVPRQWVRDLRGARPMGRPPKNKGK